MFRSSLLAIAIAVVTTPALSQSNPQTKVADAWREMLLSQEDIRKLVEKDADVKQRLESWLRTIEKKHQASLLDNVPKHPELRAELLQRAERDQHVRKLAIERDTVDTATSSVDKENQMWLVKLVDERGWPGKTLVGADGAHSAWLIAQHADVDRPFQERCLKLMREAPEGEVSTEDIAYLEDRVRVGRGEKQIYGTQVKAVDGSMVLQDVEDMANLNRMREQAEMMPIEVYLLFSRQTYARHDTSSLSDHQLTQSTVRQLALLVEKEYFDPKVGARIAQSLRDRLVGGAYSKQQTLASLTSQLTKDVYEVCNDSHFSVAVRRTSDSERKASPKPTREERGRRENFGVRRVEILDGNVGYLDLRSFYRPDEAKESIAAAMRVLQHAGALIVDMRSNSGGSPATVSMLLSYFFATETPLFEITDRHGEVKKYATLAQQLAGQSDSRPVFVLTSAQTFSGGEGFAFILQAFKRAEIIGERTAGAANLARPFRVNERIEATIPIARIASNVNGKNWEGSGVTPDIATSAADAIEVAHERALSRLRE